MYEWDVYIYMVVVVVIVMVVVRPCRPSHGFRRVVVVVVVVEVAVVWSYRMQCGLIGT